MLAILADPRANSPLPSETRLLRLQNLLRSWSLGTPTPTLAAGFLLVLSNEISSGRDFAGATVSSLLHELGELRDVWPPAVSGAGELLLSTALQCSPGDRDSYLTTCVLTIGFDFVVAEEVREGLASWLSGMASLPACAPSLSRASQLVLYRTLCHYREPSSPGAQAQALGKKKDLSYRAWGLARTGTVLTKSFFFPHRPPRERSSFPPHSSSPRHHTPPTWQ